MLIVVHFAVLLGPAGSNPLLRWGLPGLLALAGLVGFLRGESLRTRLPDVYAGIGGPVRETEELVGR